MDKERLDQIDRRCAKFSTEAAARSYRRRCLKMMSMVLGDDGKIWVTTPSEAAFLNKGGYEVIEY